VRNDHNLAYETFLFMREVVTDRIYFVAVSKYISIIWNLAAVPIFNEAPVYECTLDVTISSNRAHY
jgi:hypothetical protein